MQSLMADPHTAGYPPGSAPFPAPAGYPGSAPSGVVAYAGDPAAGSSAPPYPGPAGYGLAGTSQGQFATSSGYPAAPPVQVMGYASATQSGVPGTSGHPGYGWQQPTSGAFPAGYSSAACGPPSYAASPEVGYGAYPQGHTPGMQPQQPPVQPHLPAGPLYAGFPSHAAGYSAYPAAYMGYPGYGAYSAYPPGYAYPAGSYGVPGGHAGPRMHAAASSAPGQPSMHSVEELAQHIKQLQRASEEWKDAWHKLCDTEGGGVRDPGRHSTSMLRRFVDATEQAQRTGHTVHQLLSLPAMSRINHELVAQVKRAQRTSEQWKERWHKMCDTEGGGCRDPNRYNDEFLSRFLDSLKLEALEDAHPSGQAKLVQDVKDAQRSGSEWSLEWERYCDTQGGGVRDPSRHNAAFLIAYLDRYEAARGTKRAAAQDDGRRGRRRLD